MNAISVPSAWVESITKLALPPAANNRLQELMGRKAAGSLSESDQTELDSLVQIAETYSKLRSEAMHHLGVKPV